VDRVVAIIQSDPNKDRIDRIITRWLIRHLQRLGAEVHLDQLNSLVEDRDMLAENLENLVKKERLEGRQEGRQEGDRRALEEKRKTVRHLLSFAVLSNDQIAAATGLSVDEIVKLRIEDKH
jgi:predicted transposase/invertase (TIGR01784 family)